MKKRILSLLLALVLVMQFGIVAFAEESNRETSADYYSEQETKTGKEALSVIDIERVAKHYADVQEKNGYEVVSATKQTVYVIDTLNDRGEVYNSMGLRGFSQGHWHIRRVRRSSRSGCVRRRRC